MLELGENFDDAELSRGRVLYNVQLVAARLLQQHQAKIDDLGAGGRSSGAFLATYVLDVEEDADLNNRPYITLPITLFDLSNDGAIRYITYFPDDEDACEPHLQSVQFTRTTPSALRALSGSVYQRPSPRSPYFYRASSYASDPPGMNRVYLVGVQGIEQVEIGLLSAIDPASTPSPSEEMNFPPELLYILKRHVLDLRNWAMTIPQERLRNDGRDTDVGGQSRPPGRLVSVNDPSVQ